MKRRNGTGKYGIEIEQVDGIKKICCYPQHNVKSDTIA